MQRKCLDKLRLISEIEGAEGIFHVILKYDLKKLYSDFLVASYIVSNLLTKSSECPFICEIVICVLVCVFSSSACE